MTATPLIRETGVHLRPDPSRVVIRFFLPGREDVGPGESRAAGVIGRVLGVADGDVDAAMRDVEIRFADRHPDLHEVFLRHAALVDSRLDHDVPLSDARTLFLGASFTHEYAIEGASLCNPSAVLHPVQRPGGAAFVLSVRGIGEGHRSSIGFRSGFVTDDGVVSIDAPGPFPHQAPEVPGIHHRSVFHSKLAGMDDDRENAAYVLDQLTETFDTPELEACIADLSANGASRLHTRTTIEHLRQLCKASYGVRFDETRELSERVLWPRAPQERVGMEDARFVHFARPDGTTTYYGTYTAFDGANISQQLLETDDFAAFTMSPMGGSAAGGKGFALFPRMIDGRFAALSRSDRETNAIAFSDDIHCWEESEPIQLPEAEWEVLQLGNCGSPIETEKGWIVLTHGVGAMRTYSIGAILLDLEDPRKMIGRTDRPLITPDPEDRDGYVPNVVYSCGGFLHGDTLVVPYAIADHRISIVTLSAEALLASMTATSR